MKPRVAIALESLPRDLVAGERWVAWATETRAGKPTKVPRVPRRSHMRASVTAPDTWGTLEDALKAAEAESIDGIGRVLGDGLAALDLDACRNPQTGHIRPEAALIIERLNSYTEVSPSGSGIHVWLRGVLPTGGRRQGPIEIYERDRYEHNGRNSSRSGRSSPPTSRSKTRSPLLTPRLRICDPSSTHCQKAPRKRGLDERPARDCLNEPESRVQSSELLEELA